MCGDTRSLSHVFDCKSPVLLGVVETLINLSELSPLFLFACNVLAIIV